MNKNWKKQFLTIYTGQAFSILGSAAVQFAIIWWLTVYTESAMTLTLATIAGFVPIMLLGPFAGVWIDRYNRKYVMIAADALVALSSAVLGVGFLVTTAPPIWFVYLILFLRGLGSAFHTPAMQAAIPTLVPHEMLTKVGGWGQLISSISNMAGPVLGALLMSGVSISLIMLVDIFGAVFAIICLMFVKIPNISQPPEKVHLLADIKLGFAALMENKPLVAIFPAMVLANIAFMPLGALYPLLIRVHFGGTEWHNGLAESVFAAGMLISSLIIGVWGGMKRRFLMVSLSIAALGITSFVTGLLPPSGFWFFAGLTFLMGTTGTFISVPLMAYTQETIAPDKMGKVFSLMMTTSTIAMPAGLLLAGPVSEAIGVDNWFLYSGIVLALTGLLCYLRTARFDKPKTQE